MTLKRKDKRHAAILLASLILIPLLVWLTVSRMEMSGDKSERGQMTEGFGQLKRVTYNGKNYVHRSDLTTILGIGIDKNVDYQTAGYRNGGQADFLLLLIIDDESKTIHQLQIDRDTMTDVMMLTLWGKEAGTRIEQICLSHAFGKTEEDRCGYTIRAVENLLLGEKVDLYASVRLDAIDTVNDALGGVTVTLENDMSMVDPEMTLGKTMTLHGHQAELFVRSRYDIADGSNAARQKRQRQFLSAAADLLRKKTAENKNFVGNLYDLMGDALNTNLNRGRIINEFYHTKDYQLEPVRGFAGEHILGEDGFVEFHADAEDIQSFVISTFYRPE